MNPRTQKVGKSSSSAVAKTFHMVQTQSMARYVMLLLVGLLVCSTTSGITVDYDDFNEVSRRKDDDSSSRYEDGKFPFLMPNVKPKTPELYLCTPIKVDPTRSFYIVGYEPNATMQTAHHMLLYGCEEPGTTRPVWNCGEMAKKARKNADDEETATPCGVHAHSQILYAWARDAPKLALPDGVGFKVGKNSPIKYMVLQVHYANIDKFADGSSDDSGVFINYTTKPLNKLAGVVLLGTSGYIPPMATEHMETSCEIGEHKTVYPIAYRTHTHSLGKVVSGYRVRADERGEHQWTLLGKRDPLTPQMFYPVENREPIVFGDRLAARCTMKSTRNRITGIGATNEDEMCNFYLMYYVENDEPLAMKYCFSQGPPTYYWKNPDVGLNNIPDYEASQL